MNLWETHPLNPWMLMVQARNQLIDSLFYDVGRLTAREWSVLKPWSERKGSILVVSPSNTTRPDTIRTYEHSLSFLNAEGYKVDAIAIAGVGSSVVGTAAFARVVADTYQCDVAGIVSGYGLADVALEGLGGWYLYGKVDQLRFELRKLAADVSSVLADSFAPGSDLLTHFEHAGFNLDEYVPPMLDVTTLNNILFARYEHRTRPAMRLRLLVGHSKGSLLISSALNHLNHEIEEIRLWNPALRGHDDPFDSMAVATFGAVVDLPDALIKPANQHQFLGRLDLLGRLNSRSIAGQIERATLIDGAAHHLNPDIPAFMDVNRVLRTHLPNLPSIERDQEEADAHSLRAFDRRRREADRALA